MSLAHLNCTEVSAIDTSHKNLILRFENRIKCLNAIFWNIHQALENNERTLLVLDRKEDLEYINYFLSKHDLKPLSIIVNPKQEYLSPIVINNLNIDQPLKRGTSKNEKIQLTIEQLTEDIKSHLSQLRSPQLGKLSILDIFERNKLTPLQYQQLDLDLFQLIPFENYKEKKALMLKASEIFKTEYNFKSQTNPIKTSFVLENNSENIKHLFSDFIDDLTLINEALNKVRNQIEQEITKDSLKEAKSINSILYKIKKYNKFKSLSDSDVENLKLLIEKFNVSSKIKFVPSSDPKANIKAAEEAYIRLVMKRNQEQVANVQVTLNRINKFNAGESILNIFKKIEKLTKRIQKHDCLENWNAPITCTLQSGIDVCHQLLNKIELANFFIEDSADFVSWLRFANGLSESDKAIVNCFTKVRTNWVEVFESNYLEGFVKSELMQLQDIQPLQSQLMDTLAQYEEVSVSKIHDQYYDQKKKELLPAIEGDLTKISWSDFLTSKSIELLDKFPLVIIDSSSYEAYADLFEKVVDKTIMINGLPKQLPKEEWSKNILAGYSSQFNNEVVKMAKHFEDVQIQNYTGVEFNVNRSIRNMNVSELNMLSLYLGQSIHKLNDSYKIFQLKDKAIVSFLKDDKNAELLQLISRYGAKEIFTIENDYNLLPGVLANPDSETVILLEDNLIAVNPDAFDMRQLLLIDKIKTAGFKVVSVNNYKMLTDTNYSLSKIVNNLMSQQDSDIPVSV